MLTISGKLNYTNPKIWTIKDTPECIIIAPVDMRNALLFIWIFTPIFYILFSIISWIGADRSYALLISISAFFPLVIIAMFLTWMYRREAKLGPWFIFTKRDRMISLPRQSLNLEIEKVRGWVIATGLNPLPYAERTTVAELYLAIEGENGLHYHAIVGAADKSQIEKELEILSQATGIEILST